MQKARALPTIDILGTRFPIEVRLHQITNSQPPYNSIRSIDMDYGPDYESYRFWIDQETKEQFPPDKNMTNLDPNLVCVEIPEDRRLDPIGMKLHFGAFESWLNDIPVKCTIQPRSSPENKHRCTYLSLGVNELIY